MLWTTTDNILFNYLKIKPNVGCVTDRASDVKGQLNSCWKRITHLDHCDEVESLVLTLQNQC